MLFDHWCVYIYFFPERRDSKKDARRGEFQLWVDSSVKWFHENTSNEQNCIYEETNNLWHFVIIVALVLWLNRLFTFVSGVLQDQGLTPLVLTLSVFVFFFSRVEHGSIFPKATVQRGLSPSPDQQTPSSRLLPWLPTNSRRYDLQQAFPVSCKICMVQFNVLKQTVAHESHVTDVVQ